MVGCGRGKLVFNYEETDIDEVLIPIRLEFLSNELRGFKDRLKSKKAEKDFVHTFTFLLIKVQCIWTGDG